MPGNTGIPGTASGAACPVGNSSNRPTGVLADILHSTPVTVAGVCPVDRIDHNGAAIGKLYAVSKRVQYPDDIPYSEFMEST